MKITYGSRTIEVPPLNLRSIGARHVDPGTRERYQEAYRAGARAALKAIESGKGARTEAALFSAPCDGPEGAGMD